MEIHGTDNKFILNFPKFLWTKKIIKSKIKFEVGLVEPHLLRSWVAISRTMKRVSDLCHHISFSFGLKSGVYLTVEEFTLPPCESICDVIFPKDVIQVHSN